MTTNTEENIPVSTPIFARLVREWHNGGIQVTPTADLLAEPDQPGDPMIAAPHQEGEQDGQQ